MSELKKLEFLMSQGKITRREFMTRISALGVTATLSPMILATNARASIPKKGGRLRIGTSGGATSDSLHPTTLTTLGMMFTGRIIYNCLVEIDHNSNPIPELAESWEPSLDAKKWIIQLRKGVEFHNGKTMDAEDVIYSINIHRGKDTKSIAKTWADSIIDLKADGKYKVIFTLKDGNVDFPYILGGVHFSILPAGTTDYEKGIGTGGYMLVSHEPGVSIHFKRNPHYWKKERAHFDEVEILIINDVTARTNALKSKKIDVLNRPDRKTIDLLGKDPNIQIVEYPGYLHYTISMLTDVFPYNNNDVRLALKHAIDREHVLKAILGGHGKVGNDHPISSASRYYASELPQRRYDPDKAQYYMKKAGIKDYTFELHPSEASFGGAVDTAILFNEYASKAGINMKIIKEPSDGYWSAVWQKKPMAFAWHAGRAAEDWELTMEYASGAAWNETHFEHDRFNKLLKEARSELDEAKRREMYVEMQRIIRDEGGTIVPVFVNHLMAVSSKLKFGDLLPTFELDGLRLHERWWFQS